MMINYMKNFSV